MSVLVDAVMGRSRSTLLALLAIMIAGLAARIAIPVASQPDVQGAVFNVVVTHDGISPEESERLLAMPLELELRAVEGIEEIRTLAAEGGALVRATFDPNHDIDQAVLDVREAVDRARREMPATANEPVIGESTTDDLPMLQINLLGEDVPERALYRSAIQLRDLIEPLQGVMDAQILGNREEMLEVLIRPQAMEAQKVSITQLIATLSGNNRLIAAGSLDSGEGRFAIKIPSLVEGPADLVSLPLKVSGDTIVTLGDVASVRRSFKDRTSYARFNGEQSIALSILKRPESNVVDVASRVKAAVEARASALPAGVSVHYSQDQAPLALKQVRELEGNILTTLVLVMTVVVAALGVRSGLIVGLAVPVSFLFALIFIYAFGFSFNFMVMFGLLLGLGMLIDGAVVVSEYADRRIAAGKAPAAAYAEAAKRMFWPVTASVATTLAAFVPLLLWPGVSGKFMRYLPVTLFAVLVGSLLYALLFAPVLGALFRPRGRRATPASDPRAAGPLTRGYLRLLRLAVRHSWITLFATLLTVTAIFSGYALFGKGMIFFTQEGSQWAEVRVRGQGNLSADEVDVLVREVEARVMEVNGVKNINALTSIPGERGGDLIGNINIEMHERHAVGKSTLDILGEIRERTRSLSGIEVEIRRLEQGPRVGQPLEIELASHDKSLLAPAVARMREYLDRQVDGLLDLSDTRALPGIEWNLEVDRARAGLYGADVRQVGMAVQLFTNGIKLGEYRPADADDAVDIRMRYPGEWRRLGMLDELRVRTERGLVPLSNFVRWDAVPSVDAIERLNGIPVMYIRGSTARGVLVDDKVREIGEWLDAQVFDPDLNIRFRGANEEQARSIDFITLAFLFALMFMFILLVTQFNSFYQAFLILFAVLLSTSGVLLGLLLTGNPFSAVLTGVGVVALAGIVVNNNIVLIDTYNQMRKENPQLDPTALAVRTGADRLRAVTLTAATTVLGLLPLAANLSLDLVGRSAQHGGPVSSFWMPLSQAIVFGLTFSTLVTLLATPAMLTLPFHLRGWSAGLALRFRRRQVMSSR